MIFDNLSKYFRVYVDFLRGKNGFIGSIIILVFLLIFSDIIASCGPIFELLMMIANLVGFLGFLYSGFEFIVRRMR